jgi:Somatomedin B domain
MSQHWIRFLVAAAPITLFAGCQASFDGDVSGEPDEAELLGEEAQPLCLVTPAFPGCRGKCGSLVCSPLDPGACCSCGTGCAAAGNCCCDFDLYCAAPPPPPSCEGACGGRSAAGCWCDSHCTGLGDCCGDFVGVCTPSCTGTAPSGSEAVVEAIASGRPGELYIAGDLGVPSLPPDQRDGFLRRVNSTTFGTAWQTPLDNCSLDDARDVRVMPDGDVAVLGFMYPMAASGTPVRFFVRRYSPTGVMRWQLAPTMVEQTVGASLAVDPRDGSLLVVGNIGDSSTAAMVARISGAGASLWTRTTSLTAGPHRGDAIAADAGGRIAVVGTSWAAAPGSVITARLSSSGTVIWTRSASVASALDNTAVDVALDPTGGVYTVYSARFAPNNRVEARLLHYDASGSLLWTRVANVGSGTLRPRALLPASTGELTLVGTGSAVLGLPHTPWLGRYSAAGTLLSSYWLSSLVAEVRDAAWLPGESSIALAIQRTSPSALEVVSTPAP